MKQVPERRFSHVPRAKERQKSIRQHLFLLVISALLALSCVLWRLAIWRHQEETWSVPRVSLASVAPARSAR